MSNMHRILWIDSEIRANKYPNARKISEEFEISERQAQRDIEYLRNSLGAPLIYVAGKYGYSYEDKTYVLPHIYLTEEQRKVFGFLAYKYENYQRNSRITKVTNLFKLLSKEETMNEEQNLPVFNFDEMLVSKIDLLLKAIDSKSKVSVRYSDNKNVVKDFTLHIYNMYQQYDMDYVVAYSEEADEIKILRVDNIHDLKVLNDSFSVRTEYNKKKYEVFPEKAPFIAKIRFISTPAGKIGVNLKQIDQLLYEVEFFDTDLIINQLIINKQWVEIVSPGWLKTALRNYCSSIINKLNL